MHYLVAFVHEAFFEGKKHKLIFSAKNERRLSLFLPRNSSLFSFCLVKDVRPHRKMDQLNSLVVPLFALCVAPLRQIHFFLEVPGASTAMSRLFRE